MIDWQKYNRGLNQREYRRFINGQYVVNLDGKLYACGYTKEEGWAAFKAFQDKNKKQIENRKRRSEQLRLNNEKAKAAKKAKENNQAE